MKTRLFVLLSCLLWLAPVAALASPGGDSPEQPADPQVPRGRFSSGVFEASQIFPNTRREFSVYVPAEYSADQPASLMVFMDGANYQRADGDFRVPVVFDNLIRQGAMPVTIAVFVNPGTIVAAKPEARDRSNRSFEYDSLGDRYSRFLIDEFLPVALADLNVSADPKQRAVCGISSGGICAFTAAWERPDQFGKVLSHIGSFTNIRGGWAYPGLVRKTKATPKPIKVYLQEGRDDVNNLFGDWPVANQDLAAALEFAGYEHRFEMTEGGHSGKWAGERLPEALRWLWSEGAAANAAAPVADTSETKAATAWEPHPDAVRRDDVPQGTVEPMPAWESKIFAQTIRDWAIYVPAQYNPEQPAALMVFQDGQSFSNVKGRWRVPIVFDNLIARGDMPPTIAVFINPGHDPEKPRPTRGSASNRGFEYDSLGDRYSRLLLEEIIPEVEKRYRISPDPELRAIGGSSSGAICAFNVAWERPDAFRKVFSSVGSFTNLRGGNVFPSLVRKTEPKPLRVYMADTSGDVDNAFGSWPWANQRMASALRYMGSDLRFDWDEGYGHNADFGGARFPEAMKWLWRKETHQPVHDTRGDLRGDLTLLKLLVPGESWEVVAEQVGFADAPCTDSAGNFYFSDMKAPAVYRLAAADSARTELCAESVSGLEFGPDGLLYGCQGAQNRVISIDPQSGEIKEVARGVTPNDLAVSADGFVFITETKDQRVTRISIATGEVTIVDTGINRPNGIALSNDQGTLAVSEYGGANVWTFRVLPGGDLDAKMPTMSLRLPIDPQGEFKFNEPPPYLPTAQGDGMAVDRAGRYYVTSALGVQIFDPTGRQCGVLPKPKASTPLTSCVLAGPGHDYLYVTNGDTIFRRRLTVD